MANLQAINIGAINDWKSLEKEIDYLWENQGMYRHFQITWTFPVTRESVIDRLEDLLKKLNNLESKNKKNIDYYLLKGDIAHYLYNLDAIKYYNPALNFYETAKKIDKRDYRANWFIGQHQCLSGHDKPGIESYREIINEAEPSSLHWAFWGDYADSSLICMMHLNYLMAFENMSKNKAEYKKIEEEPFYDSYTKIKKLALISDPGEKYENKQFWKKASDEEIYLSVPLGIRIKSSKNWTSKFTGFNEKKNIAMIETEKIKGKNKSDVNSRISIISYIPDKGEDKSLFIKRITSAFPNAKKISIKNKFNSDEIYEVSDSETSKDEGGIRTTMMFIEREEPVNPGVIIEYPMLGELKGNFILKYENFYTRFSGKIIYFILLQSPESIYKKSVKTYIDFINNNLTLD